MKDCGNHNGMIVMHAFSDGDCEECGTKVVTGHIPCDKVCERCSDNNNLCHICGDKIGKVMIKGGHVTDIDGETITCLLRAAKETHDEITFNISILDEEQLPYAKLGNAMRLDKETSEIQFMKEDMSFTGANHHELAFCETCIQMTNHLDGACQKHKK